MVPVFLNFLYLVFFSKPHDGQIKIKTTGGSAQVKRLVFKTADWNSVDYELKKDPGIPRLPNLKVKVRNAQHKPQVPPERQLDNDATMASEPTLSTLAMLASEAEASSAAQERQQQQQEQMFMDPSSSTGVVSKTKEQLRKYYLKALHKVVDEADIIILVLDARDPEGCRSRMVEEEVRRREAEGKRLVFVLNKIDLIPKSNAQEWLKYLRHSTPTLPFLSSASSQHQRTNISSSTAPALMKLLKAYKPKAGSVTIGVVGYPNVGKSSLINSLKRSKVCAVAAQPGHTKELQSVQLERGMRVIDSPGVVFDEDVYDDGKGSKKSSVLLRNVVKVEDVEDPIAVVEEILSRTPPETLQKIYNLPEFTSTLEFLTMLALSNGRLLKGGTPDLNSAARQVLTDWNQQKIPYFSTPPTIHPSMIPSTVAATRTGEDGPVIAPGAENVGQAQILTEFSKPFQLEGLFGAADAGAFGGDGDVAMGDEDDENEVFWDAVETPEAMDDTVPMESDDLRHIVPRKRSRSPSEAAQNSRGPSDLAHYNRQPKRQRKSKEIPAYDAQPDKNVLEQMGRSNPLNRKTLKRDAKRARKAHRVRAGGDSFYTVLATMKDNTTAIRTPLVISNALNTPNRLGNDDYFAISRSLGSSKRHVGTFDESGHDEVLLNKLHALEDEQARRRCPIDSIPNELLALIFEFGYLDFEEWRHSDPEFRETMMQTSRRFRQLTLHTPSLWSVISLSLSNVAEEVGRLPFYLERSAQYPLDIRLSSFWEQDMTDIVMPLLVAHSKRWKRLSIIATDSYIFSYLNDIPAPILDNLDISYFAHERRISLPQSVFGGEFPKVTYLCLRNIDLNTLKLPLHALKTLEIRGYGTWPNLERFTEMLGNGASTLQRLILHVKPGQIANQLLPEGSRTHSNIVLPALRKLEIYSSEWLSSAIVSLSRIFVCPNLESFVLREGVGSASETARTIVSYTRSPHRHKDLRLYQPNPSSWEPLFTGFPDRLYVQAASMEHACMILSSPSTMLTSLELRKPFLLRADLTRSTFSQLKALKHLFFLDTAPNHAMLQLLDGYQDAEVADEVIQSSRGSISIPTLETFVLEIDTHTNRQELLSGYKDVTANFVDMFTLPSIRTLVLKNLEARQWINIARSFGLHAEEYTKLTSLKVMNMTDVLAVNANDVLYNDNTRSFPHLRRLLLDTVGSNAFMHQLLPKANPESPGSFVLPWPDMEVISVYGDANVSKPMLHRIISTREEQGRPLKMLYLDDRFSTNKDSWNWLNEHTHVLKSKPGFL
uniref:CP-type G domain-containing protein n=1 Tax=Psilocybe cubensis TaxID=181762 RepID=A0A8H7XRC6_PSICU